MMHYIYKVCDQSGRYYVGRHSTNKQKDTYYGSGKWVRSLKDKTTLTKEIIETCETFEQLLEREKFYISENIGKDKCMNFNNSSVGFAVGEYNPANTQEEKRKRRLRVIGDNNPAKRDEVRKKISEKNKGKQSSFKDKKHTEETKEKIRRKAIGRKVSLETRKQLSSIRKRKYVETGEVPCSFTGKTHSEDSIKKIKEKALKRPKLLCSFCGRMIAINGYKKHHGDNCKHKMENRNEPTN